MSTWIVKPCTKDGKQVENLPPTAAARKKGIVAIRIIRTPEDNDDEGLAEVDLVLPGEDPSTMTTGKQIFGPDPWLANTKSRAVQAAFDMAKSLAIVALDARTRDPGGWKRMRESLR